MLLTLVIPGRNFMACIHAYPTRGLVVPQVLGSICNAALKWDFPFRWIGVDEVGFRADDVDDDIFIVYVLLKFEKPLEVASSGSLFTLAEEKKEK
ncbi:hypothetical protein Q9L58_007601 [Maublancomyces gigas]|uniref:Uncharacterized protein n=1 Tax=Discina gigas TaxID=1032678 RepID=A0ABR3GC43_9PEZI